MWKWQTQLFTNVVTHTDTFLPYGVAVGDHTEVLPSNGQIGPIELDSPIMLYNKRLASLYVCVIVKCLMLISVALKISHFTF